MAPDPRQRCRHQAELARRRLREAERAVREARERIQELESAERKAKDDLVTAERALTQSEAEATAQRERERIQRTDDAEQRSPIPKPTSAPGAAIRKRKPLDAATKAKAFADLTALLPSSIISTSNGTTRKTALKAGRSYRIEPLSKRRRKNAGTIGVLANWNLEATLGHLRLSDGTMIEVHLEDLVESK